jgi:DNA-binding Lrp family transcriptional regulator
MPTNRKQNTSDDDMKVLVELQKHSNKSIDVIAKNCGFSRQKVWRIIKQMEKNHTIWGYTAVADEQKQALQKFVLLMKRSTKPIDHETADQLISYKTRKDVMGLGISVENSYFAHGEYDWILIFTAKDISHAKKFSDLLLSEYQEMVSKANLIQILMTLRSQHILNPNYMKMRELL